MDILAASRVEDIDEALYMVGRKVSAFPKEYEDNEEEMEAWRQVRDYVKEARQRIAALEAENCDLRLYLDTIYEKHGALFFAIKQYGHWREHQGAQAPEE